MRWISLFLALVSLGSPAFADGLSGTYVGKASNGAFLIQIVETSDGHLLGRYEEVILQPDGKIDDKNATVSGAADGQTVVVTFKFVGFVPDNIPASGTVQGNMLHLTGGGNRSGFTLNLAKADEIEFRAQVASLNGQARQNAENRAQRESAERQAKAETEQMAELQSVIKKLDTWVKNAEVQRPKIVAFEQSYRNITLQMRSLFEKEKAIFGDGQASFARMQIHFKINQLSFADDQLNNEQKLAANEFDWRSKELSQESISASPPCHANRIHYTSDPKLPSQEVWDSTCRQFVDLDGQYVESVNATRSAFAHLESVRSTELKYQNAILSASEDAAR